MKIYAADFESSVENSETWTYLDGYKDICGGEVIKKRKIEDWVSSVLYLEDESEINFFNLSFDGSFIVNYLLKIHAKQVVQSEDYYFNKKIEGFKKDLVEYEENFKYKLKREDDDGLYFKVGINSLGTWYKIDLWYEKRHYIIKDAAKLFPGMSLDDVAKKFLGYDIGKYDYDYDKVRYPDTELTEDEIKYFERDINILAEALYKLKYEWHITESTLASAGMKMLKDTWIDKYGEVLKLKKNQGNRVYRYFLPELDEKEYDFVSYAYKGGIVALNEEYSNQVYGDGEDEIGLSIDANSLYPSVMISEYLPMGKGMYYDSKYKRDTLCDGLENPLYIERFRCSFEVKDGEFPFVMLRMHDLKWWWNRDNEIKLPVDEPLRSSKGQVVELVMTSVDKALFFRNYDIEDFEVVEGYVYKSVNGLFDDYINFWKEVKIKATLEGNTTNRKLSKMMQNAISGKFGAKIESSWKMVYLDDNGVMKTKILFSQKAKAEYIPMSAFITAYGRQRLLEMIEDIRSIARDIYDADGFIYCDTDGVKTLLTEKDLPQWFIDKYIDEAEYGMWKIEHKIYKAKYLKSKAYLEQKVSNSELCGDLEKDYKTTCSGLSKKRQGLINFDNFEKDKPIEKAKLMPTQVKGGCALIETDFTIK